MTEWWLGLPPAQATVECGGHEHRLRWDAGALRALDHDDAPAERTLAALGGQRCMCIDVLDAWERHRDDPRVLVLASRGPADQLAEQEDPAARSGRTRPQIVTTSPRSRALRSRAARFSAMGQVVTYPSGWTAYGPSGRSSQKAEAENELFALLGLGGALPARLVATVAAAWRERLGQRDRSLTRVRPQLQAALHGRVFAALGIWLGGSGVPSELKMIGERDEPKLALQDGVVRAQLPFGWLVDVWAKDVATIWGRFCISAEAETPGAWKLATVGADFGPPALVRLSLEGR